MSTTEPRTFAELAAALADVEPTQPGRTLDLLARMLGRTDADLARLSGISRQTINGKRSGTSPISARDLWPLAEAVGVTVEVLLLSPAEAAIWVAQNRPAELERPKKLDGSDQGNHGRITHRRRDYPCKRLVTGARHGQ